MTTPNQPEKLQLVVDSLQRDQRVVVAAGLESFSLNEVGMPRQDVDFTHKLDVLIRPVDPIYSTSSLNLLLGTLVDGLRPDKIVPFCESHGGKQLELGRLEFVEDAGWILTTVTGWVNREFSMARLGQLGPQLSGRCRYPIRQQTTVRLFPDNGHLTDAALGLYGQESIRTEQLGKRGPGLPNLALFRPPILAK